MAKSIEVIGAADLKRAIAGATLAERKAVNRSINRATTRLKTQVSVKSREKTTVKAAYAKKGISIPFRSSVNKLGSKVVISGRNIPLIGFSGHRQTSKGVTGRIYKDEPRILRPRAFIATMRSGHTGIFWRNYRGGSPGRQGGRWDGDIRQFYILLNALKKKYPNAPKDLVVRLGITELFGPSLPDLINNANVWDVLAADADAYFKVELDRNLDFYLGEL